MLLFGHRRCPAHRTPAVREPSPRCDEVEIGAPRVPRASAPRCRPPCRHRGTSPSVSAGLLTADAQFCRPAADESAVGDEASRKTIYAASTLNLNVRRPGAHYGVTDLYTSRSATHYRLATISLKLEGSKNRTFGRTVGRDRHREQLRIHREALSEHRSESLDQDEYQCRAGPECRPVVRTSVEGDRDNHPGSRRVQRRRSLRRSSVDQSDGRCSSSARGSTSPARSS